MRIACLLAALALLSPAARADDPVDDHVARARAAHDRGDFVLARDELLAAYKIEPRPALLFALGQVELNLGHYKEAIDYLYSSPEALKMYAEIGTVPLPIAQKMQTLVPKEATNPDQIVGMDSIVAEAVATKFLSAPLTREQVSELVQMKNPPKP